MNRIQIKQIPQELQEQHIKAIFELFGPTESLILTNDSYGKHRGYAFVEYETVDAALLAIDQTDGLHLGQGRELRVGRPSSHIDQDYSFTSGRLYLAGVHKQVTVEDLISLYQSFGVVKGCSLIPQPDNKRKHQGYGYIDFKLNDEAMTALQTNGMVLCGLNLRVSQSTLQGSLPESVEVGALKRKLQGLADKINKKLKVQRFTVLLQNMVTEVDDDLEDDLRQECSKYGQVQSHSDLIK